MVSGTGGHQEVKTAAKIALVWSVTSPGARGNRQDEKQQRMTTEWTWPALRPLSFHPHVIGVQGPVSKAWSEKGVCASGESLSSVLCNQRFLLLDPGSRLDGY